MAYNYPLEVLQRELTNCILAKDQAEKQCGLGIGFSHNLGIFSVNIKRIEQLEAAIKKMKNDDTEEAEM